MRGGYSLQDPGCASYVPLLELQVGSADGREACMYGCFSPRAALCTSPLPVMPSDSGSEVVIEGVTPVLQCMPEL